jgi:anti-sigma factor RsiW
MRETGHYSETLQDLLDVRLAPTEEAEVRAHLAACAECRVELARLEEARTAARALRAEREVPGGLASKIAAGLDAEDAARPGHPTRRLIVWGGLAASLVMVASLFWPRSEPVGPATAARDFDAVVDGTTPLTFVTADPAALERQFATAGAASVRVFDLAMMGFTLEGGRVQSFGDVPSALYVYRNAAGERVVCQMYEGTTGSLPATDDIRSHRDFRFHVYREGDMTIVFWQEGAIVCVLASRLPQEAVVQLAFAKAMRPA